MAAFVNHIKNFVLLKCLLGVKPIKTISVLVELRPA